MEMNEEIKQEQRGISLGQTFTQQTEETTQAIETTTVCDKYKLTKTIVISIIVSFFMFTCTHF